MKKILFLFGVFIVGLQAFGQSTAVTSSPTTATTASSTTTAAAGNTQLFNNDAAVLVVGSGSQQSLTPAELTQLQAAVLLAADLANQADAAATSLQTVENVIMQNHGCTATAACSMMYQHSQQVTYTPAATTTTTPPAPAPTWTAVATQGQTVTIQAGTTVRIGDPAGTACTACSSGKPLAADAWNPQVTFTATTTLTVELSTALGGTADPAYGYVKVLQMLGTTGGVTVQP